jgi:hypothetical protein
VGHTVHEFVQARKGIEPVHVLGAVLLGLEDEYAVLRNAAVVQAQQALLDVVGRLEAGMSKRRWIALDTLLTFCPPAPCARMAVTVTSDS